MQISIVTEVISDSGARGTVLVAACGCRTCDSCRRPGRPIFTNAEALDLVRQHRHQPIAARQSTNTAPTATATSPGVPILPSLRLAEAPSLVCALDATLTGAKGGGCAGVVEGAAGALGD